MPTCLECGNNELFSSSKIPSDVPFVNPPLPLQGTFAADGSLDTVEYTGNDEDLVEGAWEEPSSLFDVCGACGSNNIEW